MKLFSLSTFNPSRIQSCYIVKRTDFYKKDFGLSKLLHIFGHVCLVDNSASDLGFSIIVILDFKKNLNSGSNWIKESETFNILKKYFTDSLY